MELPGVGGQVESVILGSLPVPPVARWEQALKVDSLIASTIDFDP